MYGSSIVCKGFEMFSSEQQSVELRDALWRGFSIRSPNCGNCRLFGTRIGPQKNLELLRPGSNRDEVYVLGECEVDVYRRELRARSLPVPISGRASVLFEVLVRSAGQVLTRDEFIAAKSGYEKTAPYMTTSNSPLDDDMTWLRVVWRRQAASELTCLPIS
jgi:DNA-binding response OmpR family regulator